MGFMDKIKGAMNAVTGNAAKITLEFNPPVAMPGDKVTVKLTATSTGLEVKSKGVFVDLAGLEKIKIRSGAVLGVNADVNVEKSVLDQAFPLAPAFVLGKGETKVWEGQIQIPMNAQPTYGGAFTTHEWSIRGRMEATGNDPKSDALPIKIGAKPA
jgi:hypothetical protein